MSTIASAEPSSHAFTPGANPTLCMDCGHAKLNYWHNPGLLGPGDPYREVARTRDWSICTQCPRTAVHDQLCATHYADEYGYTPATP